MAQISVIYSKIQRKRELAKELHQLATYISSDDGLTQELKAYLPTGTYDGLAHLLMVASSEIRDEANTMQDRLDHIDIDW